MRGLRPATRYHDGLNRPSLTRARSRRPGPQPHAQPVDDLVRPDPDQLAALDLDLGDAFHARPQLLDAALRRRLDPEVVAALLHHGYRSDLLHHQRYRVVRHARERELAALADLELGDVALVDLHDDAVGVERRELEKHVATLDRRAERLAEIALDDDA